MKAQQPSGRPTKAAASRRATDDPATRRPGTAPRKGPKTDTQRGEDPKETVPPVTGEPPQWRDPSPGWRPDPRRARHLTEVIDEIGGDRRRPRREDVYPYLLIRAVVGDRGVRPTWPPVPCWESPDVLLIDASYTGAFDPARLVVSPVAGRSYRVFVRIWNLGLLPAVGVLVRAWAVNPGFFGTGNQDDPYYRQHLIGGTWAELSDRTRPDSVAVVELDTPWTPDAADIGHHCLLAEVGSPLDPAGGFLLSNVDRHVGQRNLTVLTGGQSPQPLIAQLGTLVPQGFALEVTHAGVDALPALQALTGGRLEGRKTLAVAPAEELTAGLPTTTGRHLLTALALDGRTAVVPSAKLAELGAGKRTERRGGIVGLLREAGPQAWERFGTVTDQPLAGALAPALATVAGGRGEYTAADLSRAFGGPRGALHPLRFTLTDPEGHLVGGYTIVVG